MREVGSSSLRHSGRPARTLVADHDHVVIGERVGVLLERRDQLALAVEGARPAAEHAVQQPALDAGDLQHRAAVGRQVPERRAVEQASREQLLDDHLQSALGVDE